MPHLHKLAVTLVQDSCKLYWELLKIMVPVMILVEVGIRFGLVELVSQLCAPIMDLVGLPAESAIVLATNLLVGIYGGAAALIGLQAEMSLSVADVTILTSMMLIAHALPIEQRIVQKIGCSLSFMTLLRLGVMVLYAWLLHLLYDGFGLLQETAHIAWSAAPTTGPQTWLDWGLDSLLSLFTIFWIILALLTGLKVLELSGITAFLTRGLAPALRLFGIGPNAAPLTMVGVLLGLTFGAGLILKEVKKGHLRPKSIFLATCFMALCHSMIEDTLIIMALGGHWSGVLVGRILIGMAIMIPLGWLVHALPDSVFERFLFRQIQGSQQESDTVSNKA